MAEYKLKFRSRKLREWLRNGGKRLELYWEGIKVVIEKDGNAVVFVAVVVDFIKGIWIERKGNWFIANIDVDNEDIDAERMLQSLVTAICKNVEVEDRREHKADTDEVVDGGMEISDDVHGGESEAGEVEDGDYRGQENGSDMSIAESSADTTSDSDPSSTDEEAGKSSEVGGASDTTSQKLQETANFCDESKENAQSDQDICSNKQISCKEEQSSYSSQNCCDYQDSKGLDSSNQQQENGENPQNEEQSSCSSAVDCGNNENKREENKDADDEALDSNNGETLATVQEQEAGNQVGEKSFNTSDPASFIEEIIEMPVEKRKSYRHFNLPYIPNSDLYDYYIKEARFDKRIFRKIDLVFKNYLTLSVKGRKSPQIDKVKLIKNILKFQNPYFSNKEDMDNDKIILMVDSSGSMSNFTPDLIYFYKLAKKYHEIILIINENAVPELIVFEGKDYYFEINHDDEGWESVHKYYDTLIKKYNIKLVVAFTDWDGISIYQKLLEKTDCKMLALDVYACNYGDPKKIKNEGKKENYLIPDEIKDYLNNRLTAYIRVGNFQEAVEIMEEEL